MSVLLLFSALPETIFRVAATAIFLLAMVITILMTIAGKKTMVFGWSENCRFRHRRPLGERTGKLQKPETPLPDAGTAEMYIYTLSEKYLRFVSVGSVSALVGAGSVPVCGGALSTFLPLGPFACERGRLAVCVFAPYRRGGDAGLVASPAAQAVGGGPAIYNKV